MWRYKDETEKKGSLRLHKFTCEKLLKKTHTGLTIQHTYDTKSFEFFDIYLSFVLIILDPTDIGT